MTPSRVKNRDEAKREWIRTFPCLVFPHGDCVGTTECAHIRHGVHKDDDCMVPLCRQHHQEQHNWGNLKFQRRYDTHLTGVGRKYHATWIALQEWAA